MVEVKFENGKMRVKSDYNPEFIEKAKCMQGKWNAPFWDFPEENEEVVRNLLLSIYGEDGTPCESVTVDIVLDDYSYGRELTLDTLLIASRHCRDYSVKLSSNAIVVSGRFSGSGGSVKHPAVTHDPGTVVRVKNVPVTIFKKVENMPGISLAKEDSRTRKQKLEKEKAALLERIIEIEAELENLG